MTLKELIISLIKKYNGDKQIIYNLYDDLLLDGKLNCEKESFKRSVRKVMQNLQEYNISSNSDDNIGIEVNTEYNEQTISSKDRRVKTLDDLIAVCKIELSIWKIDRHVINKWEVGTKVNDEIITEPLFQVKAWLSKIIPDEAKFPIVKKLEFPAIKKQIQSQYSNRDVKKTIVIADHQIGFLKDIRTGKLTPFHDRKVMSIQIQAIAEYQPDEIIIAGDLLDCTEASKYTKLPEFYYTLQPALNECGWFLSMLREVSPSSKIVFLYGNHDLRLEKYIMENMLFAYNLKPYNKEIPVMSLKNLLSLEDIDIEVINAYPKGAYWINNKLKVIHGEYLSVKKELTMSDYSVIMGHLHGIEQVSRTIHGIDGARSVTVSSVGCSCKIDGTVPGVNSKPDWQQGFIKVESTENSFNVQHYFINDGKCTFDGKHYTGTDYESDIIDVIYFKD